MPKWKTCSICKARLPLTAYGRNTHAKDGLHYYCRVCAALKRKAWYEANKVKARESTKKWVNSMSTANAVRDPYGS